MPLIDQTEPLHSDDLAKVQKAVSHGLITPPPRVREMIEQERTKHPPELFARNEERLLNEWTIGYVFDSSCLEVIYRRTPLGPEVIAVGMEEVIAFKKVTPLAEQNQFQTFLGY